MRIEEGRGERQICDQNREKWGRGLTWRDNKGEGRGETQICDQNRLKWGRGLTLFVTGGACKAPP